MPKRLTKELQDKLQENASLLAGQGATEDEIQEMAFSFVDQFGVDEAIEKKKSIPSPSPIQPQSQSVLSQATNGLFGGSQLPQENTQTEQSNGQSSTRGISLLRGKSVKPIQAQQGKTEEKKRDKQDVISYASNKLANVFARGDEGMKQELIPNIEKELQSGKHGDVYDYFETKKVDDDFVKNASPTEIVQSANSKADALKNSPQELAVYETTKESKIANLVSNIQNGEKIGERDIEYLKQNAPIAYKDMLRSVEQFNTDFPIQNINTVAEINKRKVDVNNQVQGARNIQQSVQAFSSVIPEDMLGMGVINSKLKGIKDTYANELKKLEEQYPIETETVKVAGEFDTRIKPRPQEYIEAKQELEQKRDELLGMAGRMEAVYYAKKNPNANATEIGKKFVEVQSPTMYSLYQKAGNSKGFEADLTKMGIDAMLTSGDPNLIAKGKEEERTFNDKYPEFKERELLRKLAVEHYKGEGIGTIGNSSVIDIKRADKLIEQFPDKDRDFYFKTIRPQYAEKNMFSGNYQGIPIPKVGGLINSFLEGASMPFSGAINLLGNLFESDQQKAQRALLPQRITEEELVQKDKINSEIESLLKKDKLNVLEARKLSDLYTQQSLKTDAQRFGDGSMIVAGQVFAQAGAGQVLGAGTSALLSRSSGALKGLGYLAQAEKVAELASNMSSMSNFGNSTFAFLSSYDDASLEMERLAPDASPLFKTAYATSVGLLNSATENIFKDAKIFDAFKKEVAPEIASLVANLSAGSITEEVFRREASTILKNRIPKYLGNVAKENVKESIEEATTEAGGLITKLAGVALGEIDPSQVNVDEGIEAIGQVFKQTAIDGLLVSALAGRGESLRSRTTQRALYELATNQQQLDGFIDAVSIQQQQNKMSVEDATDKIKTARTLNEVATKIIPALEKRITLNDNQKIALTSLLTLEKKLENDLSNPQNSGIKSVIESQLADVRNKKEGILKGEYIVDENFNALTPDELKQKVQEEKESDEELKKSISKVNTNPSFVIVEENDGTFSVLIDNEKKEEGFKTKEEASQRVLKLNGIQFEESPKSTRKVTEKDGVTIEMPYNKITEEGGVSYEEPSITTPNKVVEKDGIAIELPPSQEDLQTTQNTPQNEQETIETTNTEVATNIGQQPSNAPIQEEDTKDVTQSEIGIHESTKGVMNGMNVNIERKDDGNYIYSMLGDKIPFTKEQHDELVASKELIITKGKEVPKTQTPEAKVEQQPTTSSESDKVDTRIKPSFESNIESLTNPETGLGAVTERILDEQQPFKDTFLKRKGLSIEQFRLLNEEDKSKIQNEWVSSKEFKELSDKIEQQQNEGKGTKELPSEPIQPKGSSKGKDKEGVGEAVQQGTKGTNNAVAGTTTSVLEEGGLNIEFTEIEDRKIKDIATEANLKVGSYVKSIPTDKKNKFGNSINEYEATNPFTNEKVIFKKQGDATDYVIKEIAKATTKSGREEIFKSIKEQPKAETPKQNIKQNEKQQSKPKGTDVTKQQTPDTETSGDNKEGSGKTTLKEDRRGKTPKSKRKIKNPTLLSALKVDTAGNPYWHVLQYFINKGDYSAELLTEIYGKAKRGGNDLSGQKTILPEGEKRARIEFLNKKSFKTVDSLAEWLSEGYLSENMIMDADDTNDSRAFRELVEDAINSFGSRMEMADYILEQANQEPDYYIDEYDEIQKEYGGFTDDAIDYLSNLSDEQLLELDKDMDAFFEANESIDAQEDFSDVPFSANKPKNPISKKGFNKLIKRIKKAFPNTNFFTDENTLRDKLSSLGYDMSQFLSVWHGSPYDFDKFSLDKIGTGEGAQAFGYGLYFTDVKSIADNYAEQLSKKSIKEMYDRGEEMPQDAYDALNEVDFLGYDDEWKAADTFYKRTKNTLIEGWDITEEQYNKINNALLGGKRNIYKVSLHQGKTPDQYNWLEWDKPVTETQLSKIKEGILNYDLPSGYSWDTDAKRKGTNFVVQQIKNDKGEVISEASTRDEAREKASFPLSFYTYFSEAKRSEKFDENFKKAKNGKNLYDVISGFGGSEKNGSLLLLLSGIDGIKYPAESISRGTTSDNARGFNYVVFDENAITIEEKIQFMRTPKGVIYGAKLPDGSVYINPDYLSAETPIHEASHLWEQMFPAQWEKGVELFKNTIGFKNALKEIEGNPFYNYLTLEQKESEALNTLIGKKGEGYYKSPILLSKFQNWLTKLFKTIGDKLGLRNLTPDDTLDFFVNKVIGDVLGGKELKGLTSNDGLKFSSEYEESSSFKKWKGDNELVSGDEVQDVKTGQPIVVRAYHGTTNEFYEFDSSVKGNIEGHLGKVNYFTTSEEDASENYLSKGADITSRVENLKERIFNDLENEIDDSIEGDEREDMIRSVISEKYPDFDSSSLDFNMSLDEVAQRVSSTLLVGGEEQVLDLYVKLNNPIVLGNGSTWFDALEIDETYLEEATQEVADEYGISEQEAKDEYDYEIRGRAIEKQGEGNKVVEALEKALDDNGYDSSLVSQILGENYYEAEVDLDSIEKSLRKAELYDNSDGELASSQVIADLFKNLGFDGIILTDVSDRFKNMGLNESTSHIHVFDEFSNQIKLADGTNTTFNPETKDIRYSAKDDNAKISKSISKLSELSNKIDNAQTTSEARKAKEDYDNELKKDSKLNFIITNFTSITDQLEKLKLITKKGDC